MADKDFCGKQKPTQHERKYLILCLLTTNEWPK